jgi:hypothetical protein
MRVRVSLDFDIFCKMGKKSDLSPECQKFVKKLFAFFSKEKATTLLILNKTLVYFAVQKSIV